MPLITAVLKPEEFNAVTLSNLLIECHIAALLKGRTVGSLADLPEGTRLLLLDQVQWVLDALVTRGVLGTE